MLGNNSKQYRRVELNKQVEPRPYICMVTLAEIYSTHTSIVGPYQKNQSGHENRQCNPVTVLQFRYILDHQRKFLLSHPIPMSGSVPNR